MGSIRRDSGDEEQPGTAPGKDQPGRIEDQPLEPHGLQLGLLIWVIVFTCLVAILVVDFFVGLLKQ